MGVNRAFNVRGVDIVTAGNDHVLEAVDNERIASLVEVADIARPKVPIDHRTVGLVFTIPIALHDLRTGDNDLAGLAMIHPFTRLRSVANLDLGAGKRQSYRTARLIGVGGHDCRRRRQFGGTIDLPHPDAANALEFAEHIRRQRRAPAQDCLHGFPVIRCHRIGHQQRNKDGGDATEESWPALTQQRKRLVGHKSRNSHQFGPKQDGKRHADRDGGDVREWQGDQQAFRSVLQKRKPHPYLARIGRKIGVRQHCALRRPGGAAGILQHRERLSRIQGRPIIAAIIV